MNHYEAVFILNPVLSEDQVKETVKKFENFLNLSADLDSIRPETLTINCTLLDYISVNENFILIYNK